VGGFGATSAGVASIQPASFTNSGTSTENENITLDDPLGLPSFFPGSSARSTIPSPVDTSTVQLGSFGRGTSEVSFGNPGSTQSLPSTPKHSYEIFCTSDSPPLFTMCKGVVGQGSAFCMRDDCDIRSHKTKKASVKPNYKIDEVCFNELKHIKLDLNNWSKKFSVIYNVDTVASIDAVEMEEFYIEQAINQRTPLKTSLKGPDTLNYFELTPYKRQFDNITRDELVDDDNVISIGLKFLRPINDSLFETSSNLLKLRAAHDDHVIQLSAACAKADVLQSIVGNQSLDISEDYQAPTLWGSVAVLATHINRINDIVIDVDPKLSKLQKEVIVAVCDAKSTVESFNIQSSKTEYTTTSLSQRVDKLRDTVIKACESIESNTKRSNKNFEVLNSEMDFVRNVRGRFESGSSFKLRGSDAKELREEIERVAHSQDDLKLQFRNLSAQTDKESVKFCNLGFRTFQDASAWIDIHFPDYSFGLIMSAFTVLEHIHSSFTGQLSLEHLNHLYKLKIDNLNKGYAITSFDSRWPKYFMKGQSLSTITADQSFFDRIPTYDAWDENQTGFRDRLKEELESFKIGYERMTIRELDPNSQAYTIAYHSVTASISFLESLIIFVDDIYKELSRAKFSKVKAWALVTRLMRRIFMDIGLPRVSVQNQFRTGQDEVIAKHIFWAEVQCLEIMHQFKTQSFKDHPAIASEYVKFLVTNTGIDSLERLIKRVDTFDESIKELQKLVKAATTAATTASNKADEVKKFNADLSKRVSALEKSK
jgi:hypothetical protein